MAHGEHGYLFANVVPVGSMSWDLEGAAENIGVKSGEGDEMILVHRLAFFFFFLVSCILPKSSLVDRRVGVGLGCNLSL